MFCVAWVFRHAADVRVCWMSSVRSDFVEARSARVPLARVTSRYGRADRSYITRLAVAFIVTFAILAGIGAVVAYRPLMAALSKAGTPGSHAAAKPVAVIDTARKSEPEIAPVKVAASQPETSVPPPAPVANETAAPMTPQSTTLLQIPSDKSAQPAPFTSETQSAVAPSLALQGAVSIELAGPSTNAVFFEKLAKPSWPSSYSPALTDEMECVVRVRAMAAKAMVFFDSGSSVVPFRQTQQIREVAEAVSQCTAAKIDVAGHADKSGEQLSNLQLSWQRAEAVIALVSKLGFKTDQFSPVGYGFTRPIKTDGKALNRRVEFIIR